MTNVIIISKRQIFFMKYTYIGDRHTDPHLKGMTCEAVRNDSGKCIRGKNGNMLVRFYNGNTCVVVARLLRKLPDAVIAYQDINPGVIIIERA